VANQRVAAFDVAPQVWERPLPKPRQLPLNGLDRFTLKHLQAERELGDLHSLRVYVDAVDVVQQNALPFCGRELPGPGSSLVQLLSMLVDSLLQVLIAVSVEQMLVRLDQE